jgi:N-methylhydantoinase B/oxoprolinase/acetone carboxylase alpha subunit
MNHELHPGGTGARPRTDGLSATAFPSRVKNAPVEITETLAPVVVWSKEYRQDLGGGYGDPHKRPAAKVAEDVALGLVSAKTARELYARR